MTGSDQEIQRSARTGKYFLALAAISGAMAVIAGALGAHAASEPAAQWLTTGSRYQFAHIPGLIAAGYLCIAQGGTLSGRLASLAGILFFIGLVCFTGSLYALGAGAHPSLGAITPVGGVAFIAGWLALGAGFVMMSPGDRSAS